ncbi:hypothetical protein GGR56DRAFT_642396 [Xylariaceae sp. FL0804]|nr:hypothetical protein GGR56DRAFT_642396 [Xylariaceae sp. FL0804]
MGKPSRLAFLIIATNHFAIQTFVLEHKVSTKDAIADKISEDLSLDPKRSGTALPLASFMQEVQLLEVGKLPRSIFCQDDPSAYPLTETADNHLADQVAH